jgi:hypothetical protein
MLLKPFHTDAIPAGAWVFLPQKKKELINDGPQTDGNATLRRAWSWGNSIRRGVAKKLKSKLFVHGISLLAKQFEEVFKWVPKYNWRIYETRRNW